MVGFESFLDFKFNDRYAHEFGIIRTSSNNRYEQNILQQRKDVVSDVPGADGQLYWGSTSAKREIRIDYAFDGLTEKQLNEMLVAWDDRKLHKLILAEEPYKYYLAKLTGNSTLKHLCFEIDGQRVYRGEGSFIFTSYSQYVYGIGKTTEELESLHNVLITDTDTDGTITLLESNEDHDIIIKSNKVNDEDLLTIQGYPSIKEGYYVFEPEENGGKIKIYNYGDVPTNFVLHLKVSSGFSVGATFNIKLLDSPKSSFTLKSKVSYPDGADIYIDSKNYTTRAEYIDSSVGTVTNNLSLASGTMFLLPVGESTIEITGEAKNIIIEEKTIDNDIKINGSIELNYLYL